MVRNLWDRGLAIGHGHAEGFSKHGYIIYSAKKWITFAVHE